VGVEKVRSADCLLLCEWLWEVFLLSVRVNDNFVAKRLAEGIAPWTINKEVLVWSMILKKAKL
jgi:hypothetical protein